MDALLAIKCRDIWSVITRFLDDKDYRSLLCSCKTFDEILSGFQTYFYESNFEDLSITTFKRKGKNLVGFYSVRDIFNWMWRPLVRGYYKNGKKYGMWKTWKKSNGQLIESLEYYPEGELYCKREWHRNGRLKNLTFYDKG